MKLTKVGGQVSRIARSLGSSVFQSKKYGNRNPLMLIKKKQAESFIKPTVEEKADKPKT